jgi:hypothetical protein
MKILKTTAIAALLSLLTVQLRAQPAAELKTWLNIEAGPQWSMLKVSDPNGYFQGATVRSFASGITVGQEIVRNLTLSTGVLYIPRNDGLNMIDDRPNQSGWHASNSFLIPLRAEYTIWPGEYPLSFTPRIGYIYNIETRSEEAHSASSILSSTEGTVISYAIQQESEQDPSHLLEVGIGVNLRFSKAWQTSLNLSYMTSMGGSPSNRYALDYNDGNGTSNTEYTTKGNTLITTLALNIPLSNIWQLKSYRVRKRIENSTFDGKGIKRKGIIYVGGELGSLWRSFSGNNPAVGPRPMEDRGLFRYANLHTGIYAGYMFTEELGVDIGAIYQRSSTHYALMYDHEVDFVTSAPAPLYLEIPVRFRYFYDLYKGKVHAVIYGGASLLTQFSSGIYDEGSGDFTYTAPGGGGSLSATSSYAASGVRKLAPVLRLGTGVEYRLPMEFPLIATFYVNYMQGFLDTGLIEVTNSIPENPTASNITYQGSGWSVDLGVKIPFKRGRGPCDGLPERE